MIIWRVEHKISGYGPFSMFNDFEYLPAMQKWWEERHQGGFPTAVEAGLVKSQLSLEPSMFHGLLSRREIVRWFGDIAEHLDEFSFVVSKYSCPWQKVITSPTAGEQVLFEKSKAVTLAKYKPTIFMFGGRNEN